MLLHLSHQHVSHHNKMLVQISVQHDSPQLLRTFLRVAVDRFIVASTTAVSLNEVFHA